ncbi:MAG: hypothetical protein WC516_01595 [Patescibacteria group bacterium]
MIGALLLEKLKKIGKGALIVVLVLGLLAITIAAAVAVDNWFRGLHRNTPPNKVIVAQDLPALNVKQTDMGWHPVVGGMTTDPYSGLLQYTFLVNSANALTDRNSYRMAHAANGTTDPDLHVQVAFRDNGWWVWVVMSESSGTDLFSKISYAVKVTSGDPAVNLEKAIQTGH